MEFPAGSKSQLSVRHVIERWTDDDDNEISSENHNVNNAMSLPSSWSLGNKLDFKIKASADDNGISSGGKHNVNTKFTTFRKRIRF